MDNVGTLLDYEEVAGFKVKPWGIVDLSRLSQNLSRIFYSLKEHGVNLDNVDRNIDKVIFSVLPEAPEIISLTLGITIEEVAKLTNEQSSEIVFTIIRINMEYLKNWFAPLAAMIKGIAR